MNDRELKRSMKILFLFFAILLAGCSLSAIEGGSIEADNKDYPRVSLNALE